MLAFPQASFALGPVYFDIEGLIILFLFWIASVAIAFFIKPRKITLPIAFLWPIAYIAVDIWIAKHQRTQKAQAYAEAFKSVYKTGKKLCESPSTITVNRAIFLNQPTSIRLVGDQSYGLIHSNNCWNTEDTKKCDLGIEQEKHPCWMTGQGCKNDTVEAIEFSDQRSPTVSKIKLPAPNLPWKLELLPEHISPFELRRRVISSYATTPHFLRREELSLIDTSTNEMLSKVTYIFFDGREGIAPEDDPELNKPSFSCPDRDQTVADLFSATFKIKNSASSSQ